MKELTSGKVIDEMLKKIAITARAGIVDEEWTEEECLAFIKEKGNKYMRAILEMDVDEFNLLAVLSYIKSDLEIKKVLKEIREEENDD